MTDHPDQMTEADDRSAVPLTAAADQLGLSLEAARSRCRRGALPCTRLPEGGWLVSLTDHPNGARPVNGRSDQPVAGHDQHATGHATGPDPAAWLDLSERYAQAVAAAALWQERARGLEQRLAQLEAGPIADDVDQAAQDVPQERAAGSLRGDRPAEASETLRPSSEAEEPALRRWWRRIWGG